MADIAILVAEEYERRSRPMIINSTNDKHKGGDGHGHDAGGGWAHQKFDEGVSWMKKVGEEKFDEYAKKVFDPKTTFALEAINGLFSA